MREMDVGLVMTPAIAQDLADFLHYQVNTSQGKRKRRIAGGASSSIENTMNPVAYPIVASRGSRASVPYPVELFPAAIQEMFETLQSIATCDDRYEQNEQRPSRENVAWATKVLLRVLPRHYLSGAEIDTFHGEIHVSWEHKDKRVVAFLPAPNLLKLYCERTSGEQIEHHLQTSNNPWEISGVLRWLFE